MPAPFLQMGAPKRGWPTFNKEGKVVSETFDKVTGVSLKVYLAGPMRGYDQFNFPAFDKAAKHLRSLGYEVASPAEHDREKGFDETLNSLDGFSLADAVAWDLEQVQTCDLVVLLPGWEASTGVRGELAVAAFAGKPVKEFTCLKSLDLWDLSHGDVRRRSVQDLIDEASYDAYDRGYESGFQDSEARCNEEGRYNEGYSDGHYDGLSDCDCEANNER